MLHFSYTFFFLLFFELVVSRNVCRPWFFPCSWAFLLQNTVCRFPGEILDVGLPRWRLRWSEEPKRRMRTRRMIQRLAERRSTGRPFQRAAFWWREGWWGLGCFFFLIVLVVVVDLFVCFLLGFVCFMLLYLMVLSLVFLLGFMIVFVAVPAQICLWRQDFVATMSSV